MTHDEVPEFGWQSLAELNLLVASNIENQVQAWLFETRVTLGFHPELLNRMLNSALEAIARQENTNNQGVNLPIVHLRLYIPLEIAISPDLRRNWGFFCINKLGVTSTVEDRLDHLIEFYLYQDG